MFSVLFVALCIFLALLAISWIINKILGRPAVNGSAIFFWLLLTANLAMFANVMMSPDVDGAGARGAGRMAGYSLFLLAASYFMARRFKKRKTMSGPKSPE